MTTKEACIFFLWVISNITILCCYGQSSTTPRTDIKKASDDGFMKMFEMFIVKGKVSKEKDLLPQSQQELPSRSSTTARSFLDKDVQGSSSLYTVTENKNMGKRKIEKQVREKSVFSTPEPGDDRCRRYDLWISSKINGIFLNFLRPKRFNAYVCRGSCVFSFKNQNATLHARIQSILHLKGIEGAVPPCCVPTKLKPLKIVYRSGPEQRKVRYVSDMVVEECGCM